MATPNNADQVPDFTFNEIRARLNADNASRLTDAPSAGESIFGRETYLSGTATASGALMLSGFTALSTQAISQVRVWTGTVAAGATPTLCRIGIYQRLANNDLSLVASIANDTTLFAAANTTYTRSLTSTFSKVAGVDYAVGILVVTAAAQPNFGGPNLGAGSTAYSTDNLLLFPQIGARLNAQADLPATVTAGSTTALTFLNHTLLLV